MNLAPVRNQVRGDAVFTVIGFFTEAECQQLITFSEDCGFSFATVGGQKVPTYRNNARVDLRDAERAQQLFERALPFLPTLPDGRKPVGIFDAIRFYRYKSRQHFNWHSDGIVKDEAGNSSAYTFLIYLNDDFEGGQTAFYNSQDSDYPHGFEVEPQTGLALFFQHRLMHRGETVTKGCKYVLRSDILFR